MLKSIASLPISFKLMITTTLLLLFTVGLYGAMNVQNIVSAYDDSRTEQQDLLLQAVTQDARNVTGLLAYSARSFIAATAYGDIQNLLDTLTAEDARYVYARVYDGRNPSPPKATPTPPSPTPPPSKARAATKTTASKSSAATANPTSSASSCPSKAKAPPAASRSAAPSPTSPTATAASTTASANAKRSRSSTPSSSAA
jgi:hypothetical protein